MGKRFQPAQGKKARSAFDRVQLAENAGERPCIFEVPLEPAQLDMEGIESFRGIE